MLEDYLKSFQILSEDEIQNFINQGEAKKVKKGGFLAESGKVNTKIFFINEGILRSFYWSSTEEDITYCFRFSGSFASAYSSYLTGKPSVESLQAITDTEVLFWTKEQLIQLEKESSNWTMLLKVLAEYEYIELEQRIFMLQKETAESKYLDLLQNQPQLVKEIPLNYLASYLGITQRHLSRIRKTIY
ncbi:Crp/Fnr family transcriptional regulator [uncultured Tenacibaculum sp.]|uniref:Crp/Fnr family transcriptional regulator n=1 Tax=uncultured Tenacibaculum sp. TaxID=174713 RepID=UPI00261B25DA|nr:Crp/Fnr family transcriptional regulator [uncultured Tenacibaculum sp.]